MGTDTTVSIALIFAGIAAAATIYNLIRNGKQDVKNDSSRLEEIKEAVIKANIKLDTQCGQLTDLASDMKSMQRSVETIKEEQIRQASEIKAIWRNIDEIKKQ